MKLGRARNQIDADTGLDAIADFLVADHAVFTVEELALRSGRSISDVLDHLHAAPGYAIDAAGKQWTTMDAYLSGDLWPKLEVAQRGMQHEGLAPGYRAKYAAQLKAIKEAIARESLEDIDLMLNSGFITPENVNAFFQKKFARAQADHLSGQRRPPTRLSYNAGNYVVARGPFNPDIGVVMPVLGHAPPAPESHSLGGGAATDLTATARHAELAHSEASGRRR